MPLLLVKPATGCNTYTFSIYCVISFFILIPMALDSCLAIFAAKLEAGTNAKSRPMVTAVAVNLSYCPLSPPLKCLKSVR